MAVILGGNTGIYLASSGGPTPPVLDPDATAFLTAAGITDPIISSAINTLVIDLKNAGVWSRALALYPFVGDTASTHKWNLKNPQDTNAAYRLQFNGGFTHSANGVLPNGTNSHANTFLDFNTTVFTEESTNLSYYSRSNVLEGSANGAVMGAFSSFVSPSWGNYMLVGINASGLRCGYRAQFPAGSGFRHDGGTAPSYSGLFQGNILTGIVKMFRNNVQIDSTSIAVSNRSLINLECFLFCYNSNGSPIIRTVKESAWAGITLGLTDQQMLDYNAAIQAFQTTLGRQV